jgi:SagB-type dehydrogenase family enzyme
MDGSRTVEELALALPGLRAEHIRNAISQMSRYGLLEDGRNTPTEENPESRNETLSFFRRCLHARRATVGSELAYENLQRAEIIIIESGSGVHQTEILRSLLVKAGVRHVSRLGRLSLSDWEIQVSRQGPQPLLISVSSGTEDYDWHAQFDDWCFKHQLNWLRSSLDRSRNCADVGPRFDSKVNPCYRCFSSIHCNTDRAGESHVDASIADFYFWFSILAIEIIYLVSDAGLLATGTDFQRYNLPQWSARSLRWPRIPGCSRCRPVTPVEVESAKVQSKSECVDTATVFEDYVGLQSVAFSIQNEPMDTHVYSALALPNNQMRHCNQHRLTHEVPKLERSILDLLFENTVYSNEPIELNELSTLLLLTGGIRKMVSADAPQRWAATAGNLGSVELFVIANRVRSLPSGFYRYQPGDHSLVHFQRHTGTLSTEELISRTILGKTDSLPDVLVILVGAYGRVAQKYNEFAYRLINLDSGSALSQFHLVARTLNFFCHTATHWADDLIEEQLNLDPTRERCTGVVALYQKGFDRFQEDLASVNDFGPAAEGKTSSKVPCAFYATSVYQLAEMLYRESRLVESDIHLPSLAVPSELHHGNGSGYPWIVLPPPSRGGRLLGEVLSCRKSIRRYPPGPVSMEQLSTMLNYAHETDRTHWSAEHAKGLPLTFLVIAFRVEGLPRAVYTYESERHAVYRSRAAPSSREAAELFVQSEFADAPLVLWIAGNLAGAVARHGTFGHRQLLLRAGAAAHRLWMAGMATGLSGCIVAGVVPGAARQHLGLDGYKQASLLTFAAGASSLT